ncbi:hypothetical protein B566_EDAN004687 [Ephemera danica]|nr:hypothetical protein B566_EDAN004687 [Ephemera danica]
MKLQTRQYVCSVLTAGLSWVEGSRRQQRMPTAHQFPCRTENIDSRVSTTTSVHHLRPRDVSVVAALGDSLVTGLGALAESIPELFRLDQGVSWSIGEKCYSSLVFNPNTTSLSDITLTDFFNI